MEIRNQQFKHSIRGYNVDEVKSFITKISADYEDVFSENAKLKENILLLERELSRYKRMEETMNNSLILAQQTAEELRNNSEKEAKLMMEQAKHKISEVLMIYQEIVKRTGLFNTELKAQVGGQLEIIEKNQNKIDELTDFFLSKDLKFILEGLEKISLDLEE